jgi:hypothetical protein
VETLRSAEILLASGMFADTELGLARPRGMPVDNGGHRR